MDIRLIALDLDGTTLDSKARLTEENRSALEEAIDKGILVAIASGRVLTSIPEEVRSIKGLNYVISSNGARITDLRTGENVYSNCIAPDAVEQIIGMATVHHLQLEAFWDDRAYIDAELYKETDERGSAYRRREYVLRTRTPLKDLYDRMREVGDRVENVNIFFDEPETAEVLRPIAMRIPNVTVTSSIRNNIEFGGATTSKSNAIRFLAEMHGISREQVMCFGDAPNDIAMIEYAGFGVAMGNAWGGTKDHADYIAETNDESGVGKTIRKFCL
jgi:Cof subfamily protein (haloacid dehalogenase superfamily)